MATPTDVARALIDVSEKVARALDDAPTGVTPGYSSALGGTVLPNGKLRYVAATAATGYRLLSVHYKNATQTIASSTNTIINYDQEVYDPLGIVTTGVAWKMVIPANGWYRLDATILFSEVASGWSAGDRATLRLFQNGGVVENFHVLDDPQNNTENNILRCNVPYDLNIGDEIALGIFQTSSTGKDIGGDYLSLFSISQY
jgi:hypothetical protein